MHVYEFYVCLYVCLHACTYVHIVQWDIDRSELGYAYCDLRPSRVFVAAFNIIMYIYFHLIFSYSQTSVSSCVLYTTLMSSGTISRQETSTRPLPIR